MSDILRTPERSQVSMVEMVMPQHTNFLGSVFGGTIVSWVDIAAVIAAQRHCEQSVVTASIDAMHFLAPVQLGWTVSILARVNMVAKHSCEVGVRVLAQNPILGESHHTASAYLTMVSLDSQRNKLVMPHLTLVSEEDRRRHDEALSRRKSRVALREKLLRQRRKS
ncbi:MAG: acyl-CoA thioesterase [Zetaproteobacteria bacterium]|nr:acyl-CoA thioesterase [Zetaproteobacteria bacterium]